ncbi:hypothetical protein ACWDDN_22240 [Streptomyces griseoruber]
MAKRENDEELFGPIFRIWLAGTTLTYRFPFLSKAIPSGNSPAAGLNLTTVRIDYDPDAATGATDGANKAITTMVIILAMRIASISFHSGQKSVKATESSQARVIRWLCLAPHGGRRVHPVEVRPLGADRRDGCRLGSGAPGGLGHVDEEAGTVGEFFLREAKISGASFLRQRR